MIDNDRNIFRNISSVPKSMADQCGEVIEADVERLLKQREKNSKAISLFLSYHVVLIAFGTRK